MMKKDLLAEFVGSIIANLPLGVVTVNTESIIGSINIFAENLFSVKEEKWIGSSLSELSERKFSPDDTAVIVKETNKVIKNREESRFEIKTALSGNAKHMSIIISSLVGVEEEVMGAEILFNDITDLKLYQEALREREERYRLLFNSANDAVFVHELTEEGLPGKFIEVNDLACSTLGYAREELLQLTPSDLDDPEMVEEERITNRDDALKEDRFMFETVKMTKDGRRIPVEINGHMFEIRGRPMVLAIARDISERKKAEESLRSSERKLKAAEDLGRIGYWEFDIASNYISWSDQTFKLFERDPLSGPPNVEEEAAYYSREQGAILSDYAHRAIVDGEEFILDIEAILPSGKRPFFSASMRPVRNEEGRVVKLFGTVQDITERKRMEEELRKSEQRYQALFERSFDCVYIHDLNGKLVDANAATLKMLGYTRKEILSRDIFQILSEEQIPRAVLVLDRLIKSGYQKVPAEIKLQRKDGEYVWIESKGSIVFREGKPHSVQVIARDITERKRTEMELKRKLLKFDLKKGNLYLVKERNLNMAEEAFSEIITLGYRGYYLTRASAGHANLFAKYDVKCRWFAEKGGDDTLHPDAGHIEKWIEELPGDHVILIERLDYLISRNGFDRTLHLVQILNEMAYLHRHIIIISIDPSVITPQQARMMEKECLEVVPMKKPRLKKGMLEILHYVYKKNIRGEHPSYTDIKTKLEISKPTVRKRVSELVFSGYLIQQLGGRTKLMGITEKGRRLFSE